MPGLLISYTVCYRFRTPELVLTIINLAFEHVTMSIRVISPFRTVKFSFLYVCILDYRYLSFSILITFYLSLILYISRSYNFAIKRYKIM